MDWFHALAFIALSALLLALFARSYAPSAWEQCTSRVRAGTAQCCSLASRAAAALLAACTSWCPCLAQVQTVCAEAVHSCRRTLATLRAAAAAVLPAWLMVHLVPAGHRPRGESTDGARQPLLGDVELGMGLGDGGRRQVVQGSDEEGNSPLAHPRSPQTSHGEKEPGAAGGSGHGQATVGAAGRSPQRLLTAQLKAPPEAPLVLTPDFVDFLLPHLPRRCHTPRWRLAFHTHVHGYNLSTLYRRCKGVRDCLLVVLSSSGAAAAAFTCRPWVVQRHFFGTGESAVFSLQPQQEHYGWSGQNKLFQLAQPASLAVGGGGAGFGLCLEGDLQAGTSSPCKTFSNPASLLQTERFDIVAVEVWATSAA